MEDAEEMQAHDDDGDAGKIGENIGVAPNQASDDAGARSQRNKNGREAEHEQRRADYSLTPDRRFRLRVRKTLQR